MKKGIGLLALLSCFSITSCSCKAFYSEQQLLNMNAEDTFNLLAPVAMDTMEPINYQIDVTTFDSNYGNYSFVPCLNSELCVRSIVENGETLKTLVNYKTGDTVATLENLVDLGVSNLHMHNIFYDSSVPVIVYASKDGNAVHVNYRDCYGNEIFSETVDGEIALTNFSFPKTETEMCAMFKFNISTTYFKVANLNNGEDKLQISRINETEFNSISERINSNVSRAEPLYDKDGNIFAYMGQDYTLYNSKKEFIKKMELPYSEGFPVSFSLVRLEKKLVFVGEAQESKTATFSYVEWDLITGETKYVKDFKFDYAFYGSITRDWNGKFRYTYVIFRRSGETSLNEYLKYTVLTDEFSFDNLLDYDMFYGEVYKINSDYIMAEYMDGWHFICKTSNRRIEAEQVMLDKDNKVYLVKDGYAYCITTETLIDYFGPAKEGYTSDELYRNTGNMLYVSDRTFNGKRVVIEYKECQTEHILVIMLNYLKVMFSYLLNMAYL